jgi:mannose-1-phosphate guanylyltransferase
MHLILLSGGSGKRLWPLSNDVRSKQFLKLLKDENGKPESMVQRVYRQIKEVGGWESITIAASASQRDMITLQLGDDINLVIEPERRDTFPAIALACSFLYSEKSIKREEIIAILPVDPYVDLDYFIKVTEIEEAIKVQADLLLIGAAPTFPTEKYGYIIPDIIGNSIMDVTYFKEKPTVIEAQSLISKGALWNCGVFGLKLGYILDILEEKYKITDFNYDTMKETFKSLKKTSFDYEVVEKAKNIKVIKYENKWMDLGTWQTITEEMQNKAEGNVIMDATCQNTHIINDLNLPIVAMGINDSVIVASSDGILVAKKEETHRLKEIISDINNRPMYERKRWGKYKVLEGNAGTLTKKLIIESGKQISYQYHNNRKEIWTIISGEGLLYLDGMKSKVSIGDVIKVDEKMKHGIMAINELEIIEVQIGSNLVEEDIVRIEMEWE